MGRLKGCQNKGLRSAVIREGKSLIMAAKNPESSVEQLSAATASYRRLLSRAIRTASSDDAVTLQRLGTGLTALTKAVSTVEKLKSKKKAEEKMIVDFDIMGNPVLRRA